MYSLFGFNHFCVGRFEKMLVLLKIYLQSYLNVWKVKIARETFLKIIPVENRTNHFIFLLSVLESFSESLQIRNMRLYYSYIKKK